MPNPIDVYLRADAGDGVNDVRLRQDGADPPGGQGWGHLMNHTRNRLVYVQE